MSFFKIILVLAVAFLAFFGALALFGLLTVLIKWLFIFGVIALAGMGAYKLLTKSDGPQYELSSAELEMEKAERMLAEIRRRELTK